MSTPSITPENIAAENRDWEEDAQRLNAMCSLAKSKGFVVDVDEGEPPELNSDGTLSDVEE